MWDDQSVSYYRGVVAGVFFIVLLQAAILIYFINSLKGTKEQSAKRESLKYTLSKDLEYERCDWLSAVCAKYIECLANSEAYLDILKKKLERKFADKLGGISFIESVHVTHVYIKEAQPVFKRVCLFVPTLETQQGICFDFEFAGCGGGQFRVNLKHGISLDVSVELKSLKRTPLLVFFPHENDTGSYKVCFSEYPDPVFAVSMPQFGDGKITQTLRKLLVSKCEQIFADMWVFPSARTFPLPLLASRDDSASAKLSVPAKLPSEKYKTVLNISKKLMSSFISRSGSVSDFLAPELQFDTSRTFGTDADSIISSASQLCDLAGVLFSQDADDIAGIFNGDPNTNVSVFDKKESHWKSLSFRNGMLLQQLQTFGHEPLLGKKLMHRGTVLVSADSETCFSVFSKPRHLALINSSIYYSCESVFEASEDVSIQKLELHVNGYQKNAAKPPLAAHIILALQQNGSQSRMMVFRSCEFSDRGSAASSSDNLSTADLTEPSVVEKPTFYIYAVLASPFKPWTAAASSTNQTLITVLSMVNQPLSAFRLSMHYLYTMKQSIEQIQQHKPPPLPPR